MACSGSLACALTLPIILQLFDCIYGSWWMLGSYIMGVTTLPPRSLSGMRTHLEPHNSYFRLLHSTAKLNSSPCTLFRNKSRAGFTFLAFLTSCSYKQSFWCLWLSPFIRTCCQTEICKGNWDLVIQFSFLSLALVWQSPKLSWWNGQHHNSRTIFFPCRHWISLWWFLLPKYLINYNQQQPIIGFM